MHDPFADLVGLKPAARPSVPIRNVGSASGLSSASAGTPLVCGCCTWDCQAFKVVLVLAINVWKPCQAGIDQAGPYGQHCGLQVR